MNGARPAGEDMHQEKELVKLHLNFTPEVGHETTKIAVSLSIYLYFDTQVSQFLLDSTYANIYFFLVPAKPSLNRDSSLEGPR